MLEKTGRVQDAVHARLRCKVSPCVREPRNDLPGWQIAESRTRERLEDPSTLGLRQPMFDGFRTAPAVALIALAPPATHRAVTEADCAGGSLGAGAGDYRFVDEGDDSGAVVSSM